MSDVEEVIYYQTEEKDSIEGKMRLNNVEKFLGFTWDFIPVGDVKVFEIDDNIMEFKFKNHDTRNKVFDSSPWSINRYMVNLRYYN